VIITVVVVLERRRPTTTLALVLAIVFVPIGGLLVYLVFVRRRVRQIRRRERRIVRPFEAMRRFVKLDDLPTAMSPLQRSLVKLAVATAAAPVRRADRVDVLSDPAATFARIGQAIDGADRFVHLLFYIWRADDTGRELVARLAAKARAGVRVRVLVDHLGTLGLGDEHFAPLVEAGGEVARYAPLRVPFLPWRSRLNYRNHRKIVVIDGATGFIGGANVGDEYSGRAVARPRWRDLMVEMHGDAVLGLDAVFLDDWLTATGQVVDMHGTRAKQIAHLDARRPAAAKWRPEPARDKALRDANPFAALPRREPRSTGPLVQVIPSGPDAPTVDAIAAQIIAAIAAAAERMWMVTPYFVPDEPLMQTLRTAALRGLDVRIVVPAPDVNDSRLVALAAASYYEDLLDVGARVFEYTPGMMHAKYVIIDDWSVVGSANIDVRSFYLNYEIVAMFYDAGVTADLAQRFLEDLSHTREVSPAERDSVRWHRRLVEATARVLSPLL
jgi:cardiolipin synthase